MKSKSLEEIFGQVTPTAQPNSVPTRSLNDIFGVQAAPTAIVPQQAQPMQQDTPKIPVGALPMGLQDIMLQTSQVSLAKQITGNNKM